MNARMASPEVSNSAGIGSWAREFRREGRLLLATVGLGVLHVSDQVTAEMVFGCLDGFQEWIASWELRMLFLEELVQADVRSVVDGKSRVSRYLYAIYGVEVVKRRVYL